uniref:Centrosomal protein 43 n=2 Tax=Clastoptera arizonana TaxID=38151 RepID=A0A1B6EE07_9HEMI
MSIEEDTELRDLVSQTLEAKGVLSKLRAELRANVFLALEDQDVFEDKALFVNRSLKEFVSSAEGVLVTSLVKEFLDFFGLEFTAAVFEPETQAGKDFKCYERIKLSNELKLTPDQKLPLLSLIVQGFTTKCDSLEERMQVEHAKINEEELNLNDTYLVASNDEFQNTCKFGDSHLSITLKNDSNSSTILSPSTKDQNFASKTESTKLNLTSVKPTEINLSSLEGLPPLGKPLNGPLLKHPIEVTKDIKTLLTLESDPLNKYYEEDFHCSVSDKTKPELHHSASGSEVGEEILTSNISMGLDDHTGDWSGSSNSNKDKLDL